MSQVVSKIYGLHSQRLAYQFVSLDTKGNSNGTFGDIYVSPYGVTRGKKELLERIELSNRWGKKTITNLNRGLIGLTAKLGIKYFPISYNDPRFTDAVSDGALVEFLESAPSFR